MKAMIKSSLALSILLATCHSTAQHSNANQANKTIMLKPISGIELTTAVGFVRSFNQCMANAQQQLQQSNTSKRKNAFNTARKNQCKAQYTQLAQSIDKKSLKSIDKLARKKWNKREAGPGFTSDRAFQNPNALQSGVELSTTEHRAAISNTNNHTSNNTVKNAEVIK